MGRGRTRRQGVLSARLVLCSPDLDEEIHRIIRAYHERWAGAWPPGVHQAADTAPDMPVRELSGIGPPVRDVFSCDVRTGGWLLIRHAPSGSRNRLFCSSRLQEPYGSCRTPGDEEGCKGDLM